MNRRKLISATGAASLTAAAVVVAVGANYSLFGLTTGDARAGHLAPVAVTSTRHPAPTTRTEIVYLDAPPAPAPPGGNPSADVDGTGNRDTTGSAGDASEAPDPNVSPDARPTPPPTVANTGTSHREDDPAERHDVPGTEHPDD